MLCFAHWYLRSFAILPLFCRTQNIDAMNPTIFPLNMLLKYATEFVFEKSISLPITLYEFVFEKKIKFCAVSIDSHLDFFPLDRVTSICQLVTYCDSKVILFTSLIL